MRKQSYYLHSAFGNRPNMESRIHSSCAKATPPRCSSRMGWHLLVLLCLLGCPRSLFAQPPLHVRGSVRDTVQSAISDASIIVQLPNGQQHLTISNLRGEYELSLPAPTGNTLRLRCMAIGYRTADTLLRIPSHAQELVCPITLHAESIAIEGIRIVSQHVEQSSTVERISAKDLIAIPTASGSVESLLKTLPGVSARNELSSQYSVRGGSFDENLVYIDGVEVHRPMLVRSGNQEGLSAINPDMVSSLDFSAGAFPARHGDRMSSVLNVLYRQPIRYAAKLHLGLLENRAAIEGYIPSAQLSAIVGVRYKNTRLLLNTTDLKGDYRPQYFDTQANTRWQVNDELSIHLLGGLMRNLYHFLPSNKTTVFGAGTSSLVSMNIYYEGQERDRYLSGFGSLGIRWQPDRYAWIETRISSSLLSERETFDILGEYWLSDIQDPNTPPRFNDSVANVGIGGSLEHARNHFDASISSFQFRGGYGDGQWRVEGGLESTKRRIRHSLREWHLLDSSGYSMPRSSVDFDDSGLIRNAETLTLYRHAAYAQLKWSGSLGDLDIVAEAGTRASARERMEALRISPRGSVSIAPHAHPNLSIYAATGLYYQYPFYREMRDRQGALHPLLRPQRAWHILGGMRWHFTAWGEDFRLQTEIYSKHIQHLIPYTLDNLSLQYEAQSIAVGQQRGIDLKLHGELVRGVESWVSLSVMQARMRFEEPFLQPNGEKTPTGWLPMPTDQRFALALFLQDHIPHAPFIRVHLSGHYATGVPVGHPWAPYTQLHRLPAYKRVDIGFSYIMKDMAYSSPWLQRFPWLRELTAMVEVYNLLNFSNTASYLWVTVPTPQGGRGQLAVPNYLTARSINMRISIGF